MERSIIIGGFGGQGILFAGKVLARAAMAEGREVFWIPSYGPEMRGGTANCIVIVSDRRISSPIVTTFDTVVALNQPSVDKFERSVKPGGLIIYDATNILTPPTRTDISVLGIPASEEAVKMKNTKVMNMIVLGAVLERTHVVEVKSVMDALRKVLPERHHHLLPLNEQAIRRGMELAGALEAV
jgi:2-oxoglutarate ferredoxin oxidoreductase subunit gamma